MQLSLRGNGRAALQSQARQFEILIFPGQNPRGSGLIPSPDKQPRSMQASHAGGGLHARPPQPVNPKTMLSESRIGTACGLLLGSDRSVE